MPCCVPLHQTRRRALRHRFHSLLASPGSSTESNQTSSGCQREAHHRIHHLQEFRLQQLSRSTTTSARTNAVTQRSSAEPLSQSRARLYPFAKRPNRPRRASRRNHPQGRGFFAHEKATRCTPRLTVIKAHQHLATGNGNSHQPMDGSHRSISRVQIRFV